MRWEELQAALRNQRTECRDKGLAGEDKGKKVVWEVELWETREEINAKISRLIEAGKLEHFYIGATMKVARRWLGCEIMKMTGHCVKYGSRRGGQMFVVAAGEGGEIAELEKDLIKIFKDRFGQTDSGGKCDNIGAGGERITRSEINFLYVCIR